MKKKFLSFILVICLILSGTFTLTACGGKSGEYYITTLPEEYEIVLRTQYYNSLHNQTEYIQQTFIVCIEDGHAEPTYYYKFENFRANDTYNPTTLTSNDVTVSTDHSDIDWFDLSDAVYVDVGVKYLDSNITNQDEMVHGTACITYNYRNVYIQKISKDDYHLRWYCAMYDGNGHWNIREVVSFKTTNITILA